MSGPAHIVVRADANAGSGVGHVMRAITLGAALVDLGVTVTLASLAIPEALTVRAERFGMRHALLVDPSVTAQTAAIMALHPDMVFLDGYDLSPLSAALVDRGVLVGAIDDDGRGEYTVLDLVIDPNPGADAQQYREVSNRVLAGAKYALVRSDLPSRTEPDLDSPVLVALGGADPAHLTLPLAQALTDRAIPVVVAIGPANVDREVLLEWMTATPAATLADPALFDAYAHARLAVIGAGTMLWECSALGLPVTAVVVVDNQLAGATVAAAMGVAQVVDARVGCDVATIADACRAMYCDSATRQAMQDAGRALIDGRGASRAAAEVMAFLHAAGKSAAPGLR